jgi:hypothetical protein
MGDALRSQGDVRRIQCELESTSCGNEERRARLRASSYLVLLAEQVRNGEVRAFDVHWCGDDVDAELER